MASAPCRCFLKADTLVRFLCSGKPVVEDFGWGKLGGLTAPTSFSLMSREKSMVGVDLEGDDDWGQNKRREDLVVLRSNAFSAHCMRDVGLYVGR